MSKTLIQQVFDEVLKLEEGETLELCFPSKEDMQVKKMLLFREKKKYEDSLKGMPVVKGILIRQEVKELIKVYKLKLSTSGSNCDWVNTAIIKTKDGKNRDLEIDGTGEQERVNKLKGE